MTAAIHMNTDLLQKEKPMNILAVEDDLFSMNFLKAQITELGHKIITAEDGKKALDILRAQRDNIDVVLMDREMPVMDGLTAVRQMKQDYSLRGIPVIMVTSADTMQEMQEGLDSGVFYYLTKPVKEEMLRSVLSAAVREAQQSKTLHEELGRHKTSFSLIDTCRFRFQTLEEAESLAAFMANCFHDPVRVLPGLGELLINAVEHGNLGIGYEKKSELVDNGTWRSEVQRMEKMPENQNKYAEATIAHKSEGTYVVITDQGDGFSWDKYMQIDPARAGDNHGRGIAQARAVSFDKLTYNPRVIRSLLLPVTRSDWIGDGMTISAKQWILYGVMLLVGASLAFGVAFYAHKHQHDSSYQNFVHLVEMDYALISYQIESHEKILSSLGRFYTSSDNVTDVDFKNFTQEEIEEYKSFDALGWIDYDPSQQKFYWSHISPDFYNDIKRKEIVSGLWFELIKKTVESEKSSYFLITPDSYFFNDIHQGIHDQNETENHIGLLYPVYQYIQSSDQKLQKTLRGIAFSIIDIEYLIYEVSAKKIYYDHNLFNLTVTQSDNKKEEKIIFSHQESGADFLYGVKRNLSLGNLSLSLYYIPSQDFISQYASGSSYVIFAALSGLTLALIFLRQMTMSMNFLKVSRARAEELNRLKSDFLATMSHEIRTPMNGILGMAELILGTKPSRQVENYARTIIGSGETLLDIINDILDFSKIEAGKMQIDPMDIDMLELVDDLAALYSTKATDKAVELVVRYVPGSERFVYADPVRVRQVLGNLVSNAIKFTDKGHITITIEELKDILRDDKKAVLRFSVKDTGIGLPQDIQEKIFEKFSQGDSSTTRKYGGTGLGLNISKSLVNMMGGKIGVSSRLGEGSTFWFEIPLERNTDKPVLKNQSAILKDLRVLIVDDLTVIRQLMAEHLSEAGLRPLAVESGEDALRVMREQAALGDPFQMVIIDYLMPGMNGVALASLIQEDDEINQACLIMLTAAGNPLADDDFTRRGFSAYISKPVQTKALIEGLGIIWSSFHHQSNGNGKLIRLENRNNISGKTNLDEETYDLSGHSVLLVEDNLVNQIFIKEILEGMQCDYEIAPNGKDAINKIHERNFDLVIMDCLMPVMDGYEATKEIRKLQNDKKIQAKLPIVALTANAMKGDRERCMESGMDDYISKPVRKRELQISLLKWLKDIDIEKENFSDNSNSAEHLSKDEDVSISKKPKAVILDLEAVGNARDVLKADYNAMVHIFLQNSLERIEEIQKALDGRDVEAIIRPAHTLKSTSRQMGAVKMADTAMRIEYTAKKLNQDKIKNIDFSMIDKDLRLLSKQMKEAQIELEKIAA